MVIPLGFGLSCGYRPTETIIVLQIAMPLTSVPVCLFDVLLPSVPCGRQHKRRTQARRNVNKLHMITPETFLRRTSTPEESGSFAAPTRQAVAARTVRAKRVEPRAAACVSRREEEEETQSRAAEMLLCKTLGSKPTLKVQVLESFDKLQRCLYLFIQVCY